MKWVVVYKDGRSAPLDREEALRLLLIFDDARWVQREDGKAKIQKSSFRFWLWRMFRW